MVPFNQGKILIDGHEIHDVYQTAADHRYGPFSVTIELWAVKADWTRRESGEWDLTIVTETGAKKANRPCPCDPHCGVD